VYAHNYSFSNTFLSEEGQPFVGEESEDLTHRDTTYLGYTLSNGPFNHNYKTKRPISFTCAELNTESSDDEKRFSFFWKNSDMSAHIEWDCPDYGFHGCTRTVETVTGGIEFCYKSNMDDSLSKDPIYTLTDIWYNIAGVGSFYLKPDADYVISNPKPIISGVHLGSAVVLEQPIMVKMARSGNVVSHWEQCQIYTQIDGYQTDPENPESDWIYDWNNLSKVNMSTIFQHFGTTLSESVAAKHTGGGLKVQIYSR